jgi:glycerol-3-phosphate dehydrogenase
VGAASPTALRAVNAPERLVHRYGTEAPAVVALADGRPELALNVTDLVDRRTRAGLVPEWRELVSAAAVELALTAAG